jgi:cytochrome c oxidase subunit 4
MSGHSSAKSSPLPTYFAVFFALLVGTGLTVYASSLDLGPFNAPIALAIASTKATLVGLFFMHIKGASEKLTKLVVIGALFFLLLLLGLTMTDYATRLWS